MDQWLSEPFALLSKLETVNTTQQYIRDLNIALAFSLEKGGGCLHLALYVNVLSIFSTPVINNKKNAKKLP